MYIYVCIYICIHIQTRVCLPVYIYKCIHSHEIHTYLHIYILECCLWRLALLYIHTYTCMYPCIWMHLCIHAHVCLYNVHTYTHICPYIFVYMHVCIHMQIHVCLPIHTPKCIHSYQIHTFALMHVCLHADISTCIQHIHMHAFIYT